MVLNIVSPGKRRQIKDLLDKTSEEPVRRMCDKCSKRVAEFPGDDCIKGKGAKCTYCTKQKKKCEFKVSFPLRSPVVPPSVR